MTEAETDLSVQLYPKLYADENFPLPVVEQLRRLGLDVLTMYEDGRANQSIEDEEVLAIASAKERAALTQNRKHFFRLHRQRPNHRGIVACTADPNFTRQAQRVAEAVSGAVDLTGQLIRVYRPA